ncbi:hypothetical protein PIB30_021608 [Stylosanthes scabra]|uniref:RNase H type-1 domain-containing protein n=1 Tax=Stylosanthes scabra TaxID=79078 RepID=A0ABU6W9X4_9FABA|nr:hypothetical protein [Stylosanthes scabra]
MFKIWEVWGKVLKIEEDEEGHYNSFKVLVDSNFGLLIRAMATVVIGNMDYVIFVKEIRRKAEFRELQRVEPEQNMVDENKVIPTSSEGMEQTPLAHCPEMAVGSRQDRNAMGEAAMADEDEESVVGEMQPARVEVDDDQKSDEGAHFSIGPEKEQQGDTSPTNTVTLDDDRRTEDVIQEWENELFQKPNAVIDLSIPPGFERIENPNFVNTNIERDERRFGTLRIERNEKKQGRRSTTRTSLKLNDKLKDKARSSNTDEEEEVWRIGTKVGICPNSILKAQKYLKEAAETNQQKEYSQSLRKDRRRGARRIEEEKPSWWQCIVHKAREDVFVSGGYYTDEMGHIRCWMGEEVREANIGEAYLQGLENAVQFLLEDVNVDNESINLISNRLDIVDWLKGNKNTTWQNRFLRNKTYANVMIFKGVGINYR